MFSNDISQYSKYSDYLPMLNAIIITDLIIIVLLIGGFINSSTLRIWYKEIQLSAVICDVLIIFIVLIIARFLYPYFFAKFSLWKFMLLAVGLQIIHDLLFYMFVLSIKTGYSQIIDIFKIYGKENGFGAIFFDSLMMISACLFTSLFTTIDINNNIIILIVSVYLIPYLLYSI